jgi:integrase
MEVLKGNAPNMNKETALATLPDVTTVATLDTPHRADEQPARVYLASLAPGSQRAMRDALDTIARLLTGADWNDAGELIGGRCDAFTLQWAALRYQHTQAVRAKLAGHYAPATANKMLAALRGALKAAWQLEQMPSEDYHRAANVATVRGETLPKGRALNGNELQALFGICANDPTPAGARDAALLAVLYGAGLRRSEAVALDLSDYDTETGALTVRSGKGRKARVAYATNGSRDALNSWFKERGAEAGPLFLPVLKSGKIPPRRLNDQAAMDVLLKRSREAGIAHLSPHDLRRTFISNLLDAGADIVSVQKLAGHANVTTTARYDRRGEAAKLKAAELLTIPYSKRA